MMITTKHWNHRTCLLPKFKYQWALQKLSNQADINAQEGWKEYLSATNGGNANKEVIVAVIDTGVRYD